MYQLCATLQTLKFIDFLTLKGRYILQQCSCMKEKGHQKPQGCLAFSQLLRVYPSAHPQSTNFKCLVTPQGNFFYWKSTIAAIEVNNDAYYLQIRTEMFPLTFIMNLNFQQLKMQPLRDQTCFVTEISGMGVSSNGNQQ